MKDHVKINVTPRVVAEHGIYVSIEKKTDCWLKYTLIKDLNGNLVSTRDFKVGKPAEIMVQTWFAKDCGLI